VIHRVLVVYRDGETLVANAGTGERFEATESDLQQVEDMHSWIRAFLKDHPGFHIDWDPPDLKERLL
jgi:hypothetical protein